ncbi:MAG: DUF2336 domain-containing protein [Xanthobacteraceae bacterium]|nr:DUF2336 domain-containing protein [Xanthobacteraceae bacterium]
MAVPASLIPELEEVLQHGSAERRASTLQRITTLFLNGADQFNEDHVALFDGVFTRLIEEIETKARAELSNRLAPVSNAPIEAVRQLAKDDDIAVAGPVLEQSPRVPDADLVDIAKTKSQAHLLAISGRAGIAEQITDELVRRGDRHVVRGVADNRDARLSDRSFTTLVNQAEEDGILAEKVGMRPDIPPRLFRDLLLKATEVVQQRLLAAAKPDTQAEIRRVLARVSNEVAAATSRDFSAAEYLIETLSRQGKLTEVALVDFANTGKYEEMVAALSRLCVVPIDVVDRLMGGDRPDPILILCKSAGWEWPTVKALIMARPGNKNASSAGLDTAFTNFERLSPATAQRVMRFWQARPASR